MYEVTSLTKNNMGEFKKLNALKDEFNRVNKDYFKIYNRLNSFQKFLLRKKVRLLKYNYEYIGYIWIGNTSKSNCEISAMNIIGHINEIEGFKNLLSILKPYSVLIYECEKKDCNFKVLEELGFKKHKGIIEMTNILNKVINIEIPIDISFEKLIRGKDEKLRCIIQNKIFEKNDRVPLNIDDIYYDEMQSYYYDDGAIFIKKGNCYIGYGQIIVKEGICYIVNFGILKEYHNNGYGKIFLTYLLNFIYNKRKNIVKIKVDSDNYNAVKLYKSLGFNEDKEVYKWSLDT
ncbi:GNAT family N-acetyltransferase [Clostridium aestuarii]|uniref:GNAT family N-acetyltransferase n=1 Tax=Clostridium aestuarii TaxID=338193 RepID=A0ABT4CYL4_9CLOT|nr:GNAT family N-acetyltransferase [Clostridium aestuarii]MCY6484061.1 GNAT family N-acetyltransferase [Clostridium aestuarii]